MRFPAGFGIVSLTNSPHFISDPWNELDARIQAVELTLEALICSATSLLIQMRRERNASVPVYKLPNEIFIHTISISLDDAPRMMRYCDLHSFVSVSHAWKEIIEASPSLWAVIHSHDNAPVVRKALRNSKNHPLLVYALFWSSRGPPGLLLPREFVREVEPHLHRWRFARIESWVPVLELQEVLESPAPLLEKLEIVLYGHASIAIRGLNLSADKMGRLQHLHISNTSIRQWSSSLFGGLRSLEISRPLNQPTTRQLLHVIQDCPQLQALDLNGFAGDETAIPCSNSTICLPMLKRLRFRGRDQDQLCTIVSHIAAPACTELRLECSFEEIPNPKPFLIPYSLHHYYPSLIRNLIEAEEVVLCVGRSRVIFGEASQINYQKPELSPHPSFFIKLLDLPPLEPLTWVTTAFRLVLESRHITLKIVNDFDFRADAVVRILWSLPSVTKVCVRRKVQNVNDLLRRLSEPSSTNRWTFPDLRYLRVQSRNFDHQVALGMVKRRYGEDVSNGNTSQSVPEPELPDAFDVLKLKGLGDVIFSKMKRIVGPALIQKFKLSNSEVGTDHDANADDTDENDGSGTGGDGGDHDGN